MKRILLLSLCIAAMTLSSCSKKSVELFNGKDLSGWRGWLVDQSLKTADEFTVKDGTINLSGKFGYILTKEIYSDYTLEFEWRYIGTATNSGVFLHVQPGDKEWPMCYEFQLMAGNAGDLVNMSGSSSAEYKANPESVIIPKKNPSNEKTVGEWNKGKVVCEGTTITAYVNGLEQNKLTETTLTSGRIGLQSEGENIQFRNVKLTTLK